MTEAAKALRFPSLDQLDVLELEGSVPAEDLVLEKETSEDRVGTAHEPVTIAVVLLTAAAIKGITAWLLKKRHHQSVELEVEEVTADGTTRRKVLRFEMSASTSEGDVLKWIGDQLSIDPATLIEAAKAGV
jgi:hypothetical protein